MAHRPSLLDLRANSNQSAVSTSRPLRSPCMPITGEAPPELSPLDAFALQSRLLARQLQESSKDGNRVSRLPPLTIESPLIQQGRSEFFRSLSQESTLASADPFDLPEPRLGMRTEVEAFSPNDRLQSMHPTMSRIPPTPDETVPVPPFPHHGWDMSRGRQLDPVHEHTNYFGARRERSPSPLHRDSKPQLDRLSDNSTSRKAKSRLQPASRPNLSSSSSPDKPRSAPFDEPGLAPPQSLLFPKRSPSLASSSPVPVNEESSPSFSTSFHSIPSRKLSSASVAMGSAAPSPAAGSFQRSPSVASDSSAIPRPSLNFSRPLSRVDTPGLEIPTRQASSDSQPSFVLADDSAHTPVSLHSEAFLENQPDDIRGVATSYIYSTFTLPRGKALQRSEALDSQPQGPSKCEQPSLSPGRAHQLLLAAPPSPQTRPSSSSGNIIPDDSLSLVSGITRPSMDVSTRSTERGRFGASGGTVPVTDKSPVETCRLSEDVPRDRSPASPVHDNAMARGRTPMSTGTSDSASTVRPPQTARSLAPSASEMSAEEHLAKGIECHENGSLNESTYHLRHAARQKNPTATLLYALACRHGWGMRTNQKEGVAWLRKAAEYASIEIADDEDRAKEGKKPANFLESRTRKAQFALSIYELGVSHMNGWGIEQDRSLALRCFEIAGNWGDVDALTEAGFCYAKGVGCKKDLKKSAKFYRMAEAKGMSMVGNSWIHKTKYNDDGNEASPKEKSKKKARSKSRTCTMFGLKPAS